MSVSASSICVIQHSTAVSTPCAISSAITRTKSLFKAVVATVLFPLSAADPVAFLLARRLLLRRLLQMIHHALLVGGGKLHQFGFLLRSQNLQHFGLHPRPLHHQFRHGLGLLAREF